MIVLGAGALALAAIGIVATALLATCARADVVLASDPLYLSSAMLLGGHSWPL